MEAAGPGGGAKLVALNRWTSLHSFTRDGMVVSREPGAGVWGEGSEYTVRHVGAGRVVGCGGGGCCDCAC